MSRGPSRSSRSRHEPLSAQFFLLTGVLTLMLLIGGASRLNAIQTAILEVCGLALALWSARTLVISEEWRNSKPLIFILAGAAILPLLQLIPLPFGLWAHLPGHADAAAGLKLAGQDHGFLTYSLTPGETLNNLLALIPPAAVLMAAVTLPRTERRWLLLLIPALALVSLVIGVMQLSGMDSLYFYERTNRDAAVGLFANRNHNATLMLAALPFIAGWVGSLKGDGTKRIALSILAAAVSLVIILGLGLLRSRAGILLLVPSLLLSLLIVWRTAGQRYRPPALALWGLGTLLALGVAGAFLARPLLERFTADVGEQRLTTIPVTFSGGFHFLPFGSGIGSFQDVYASVEPIASMGPAFWNHAHSDFIELWLEGGIVAVLLIAAFLAWFARASFRVWRSDDEAAHYGRIGSTVCLLVLLHSAVDYPIRTLAIAGAFAFGLALLARADAKSEGRRMRKARAQKSTA